MAVRREESFLARKQLRLRKRGEVALGRRADGGGRRVAALDYRLARQFRASRAPRYLREQLEGPLRCAEVRQMKRTLGVKHANKRDVREVQPLRDHLRAYENVRLVAPERAEDVVVRMLAARRVGVHPQDARRPEATLQRGLDALGADAGERKARRSAGGTRRRHRNPPAADVAAAARIGTMVRVGNGAVWTDDRRRAVRARDRARVAAPVQEENRLLGAVEPKGNRVEQFAGKDAPRVGA